MKQMKWNKREVPRGSPHPSCLKTCKQSRSPPLNHLFLYGTNKQIKCIWELCLGDFVTASCYNYFLLYLVLYILKWNEIHLLLLRDTKDKFFFYRGFSVTPLFNSKNTITNANFSKMSYYFLSIFNNRWVSNL